MPKSPAKAETTREREEREARDRLEHADMNLFDRFMKKLVSMPREFMPSTPKKRGDN
jgi:hypothetical protein